METFILSPNIPQESSVLYDFKIYNLVEGKDGNQVEVLNRVEKVSLDELNRRKASYLKQIEDIQEIIKGVGEKILAINNLK